MKVPIDLEKTRRRCRDRINKAQASDITAVAQVLGIPVADEIPASEYALADAVQFLNELRESLLEDRESSSGLRDRITQFLLKSPLDALPDRVEYYIVGLRGWYRPPKVPRVFLTREAARKWAKKTGHGYEIFSEQCSIFFLRHILDEAERGFSKTGRLEEKDPNFAYLPDENEREAIERLKKTIYRS